MLARLAGAARPACDSIIVKHGDASNVLAATHQDNPFGGHWLLDAEAPSQRSVIWSGTLGEDLFAAEPRNWARAGRGALQRLCDELAPQLQARGRIVCFRPHARHVLNDVPSCFTFATERVGPGQPFEIALAPALMLEPSMLDQLEDHLRRQFKTLGSRCAMVMLGDVRVIDVADGDAQCESVPLGEGVLPRDLVRRLLSDCVPTSTPIVIQGRSIERQLAWLEC